MIRGILRIAEQLGYRRPYLGILLIRRRVTAQALHTINELLLLLQSHIDEGTAWPGKHDGAFNIAFVLVGIQDKR
ncbi:hypothetical protein D3C85_1493780 [compost metagenome]